MNHMTGFLVTTALIFALAGCQSRASNTTDADIDVVRFDRVVEMMSKSDQKRSVVFIDVRPRVPYITGHIPGALHVPLPDVRAGDPRLAQASHIIVYGRGWQDYVAQAVAKKLMMLKYDKVHDFRGGMELWEAKGQPVEAGP